MPSKSPEQARLMRAAKHSKKVRQATGISQEVASEFVAADKRKKARGRALRKRQ